jgi:hypothetical protein
LPEAAVEISPARANAIYGFRNRLGRLGHRALPLLRVISAARILDCRRLGREDIIRIAAL